MSTDYATAQDFDPRLYDGVTIKRGIAWIFDVVLIAMLCALVLYESVDQRNHRFVFGLGSL